MDLLLIMISRMNFNISFINRLVFIKDLLKKYSIISCFITKILYIYGVKKRIMKKILVPVDFSAKSEEALKVAAKIARKTESEIYTLHLLDIPSGSIDLINGESVPQGPLAMALFEQTHEKFDKILDKDYLDNISVYENVLTNNPVEGISEFATKFDVDLIVMGSHGTSGLEDFFVGSNTEKVVRTSKIPVLVVKESAEEFKIDKVIIASKFTGKHMNEFDKVMHFLQIFNPEIHLLYVNTSSNFKSSKETDKIFSDFLKKTDYKDLTTKICNDYTVQKGIFNYADKIGANLITLPTHGRQGIMHFMTDSIAERIVNLAKKNILTVKIDA